MSSDAKWILGLILPFLFILAGMIQLSSHNTGQRIDQMGQRIEQMGQRIDQLNHRIDRVNHRIDQMDQRIDKIEIRLARIEVHLGLPFQDVTNASSGRASRP